MSEDLMKVSIYFNDEYIGEADSFKWKKGNKHQMSSLEIKGNYQAGED